MQQLQTLEKTPANNERRPFADLIFGGSNLQVEKNRPSLAVGINYAAFGVAFTFMAGFTFMPILYGIVMLVIGLAVILKVPGRWLATLVFALPCCFLLLYYNMFPHLPNIGLGWNPGSYWFEFKVISDFLTKVWGEILLFGSSLFAGYKILFGLKNPTTDDSKGE